MKKLFSNKIALIAVVALVIIAGVFAWRGYAKDGGAFLYRGQQTFPGTPRNACGGDPYAEVAYDRQEHLWHDLGSGHYSSSGQYNGYDNFVIYSSSNNPNWPGKKANIAAPFTVYNSASCDIVIKKLDLTVLPPVGVSGMTGTFKVKDALNGNVLGTASMPFNTTAKTVTIDISANPIRVPASGANRPKFIIEAADIDFSAPPNNVNTVAAFSFGLRDAKMFSELTGDPIPHKNYRTWAPVINLYY